MKKFIGNVPAVACVILIVMSCSDEPVDQEVMVNPDLFLTRIEENGETVCEFILDDEKRLIRLNSYVHGNATSYIVFEYDAGGIREALRYYAPTDQLNYKTVFVRDNQGRIIKAENYTPESDFEEINSISTFDYDASGRMTKRVFGGAGDPPIYAEEFIYGSDKITRRKTIHPNEPDEYTQELNEYISAGKSIHNHWNGLVFFLYASGTHSYIHDMFEISCRRRYWWSGGQIVTDTWTTATGREYNAGEYLTKQTLIRENLLEDEPEEAIEMTYEYTE